MTVEAALKAFQALSDPTRLAVFQCIRCCDDGTGWKAAGCDCGGECCVPLGLVKDQVSCAPSTLTHHLNVLREAGLVETDRRGRVQYVRVRPEGVQSVIRFLQERPITCSLETETEAKTYVGK